ncbi:hypothetical protein GR194_24890 [Klebsiella pneumoniae]|nr:hypothetical protein [Klebsiella pneumoniae]
MCGELAGDERATLLMLNMMEEDEEVLKVSFVEKLIYCLLILLVKL